MPTLDEMTDQISMLQVYLEAKEWMAVSELAHWEQLLKLTDEKWVVNKAEYLRHCVSYVKQLRKHATNPRTTIVRYFNWLNQQQELACQRQRSLPLVDSQTHCENCCNTPIVSAVPAKRKRGRPRKIISWDLPPLSQRISLPVLSAQQNGE